MNIYDEFNWVKKVICLSTHRKQLSTCRKLIWAFSKKNYPELALGGTASEFTKIETVDIMENVLRNEVKKMENLL